MRRRDALPDGRALQGRRPERPAHGQTAPQARQDTEAAAPHTRGQPLKQAAPFLLAAGTMGQTGPSEAAARATAKPGQAAPMAASGPKGQLAAGAAQKRSAHKNLGCGCGSGLAGRQQKGGRRWWSGGPAAALFLHGGGAISRPLGAPPSFPPVFGATAGSEPPRRWEGGEREGGNGGRGRGGTIRGGNERRPADLYVLNQIARAKPPQSDGEARAPSRDQPAALWASGRPARILSGGEERAGASIPSTFPRSTKALHGHAQKIR